MKGKNVRKERRYAQKFMPSIAVFFVVFGLSANPCFAAKTITYAVFKDKLMGGWLGQGAGVAWGATTEFQFRHEIIPENRVPQWNTDMVNWMFHQDDNYCEIPFVHCCKDSGINATSEMFGEYWSRVTFQLWCANEQALANLKRGIKAPWSGHYTRHGSVNDIDWQIESNWAGMMCPGMPLSAAELAFRAGHVMNYGDGVYGGVMTAAMHSAAYFAKNVMEIVYAGRDALPVGSVYRQHIDDMLAWRAQYPNDWTQTWNALERKWGRFQQHINSCEHNIGAPLNGMYILMGLLYGNGDWEQSVRISMRCGQDSDCNPSSTGAILGNWIGFNAMPSKWKSGLHLTGVNYQGTQDDFTEVIEMNCNLARKAVKMVGGTVANEGKADEVWTIPDQVSIPIILEQVPGLNPSNPALSKNGAYSQDAALMPTINTMTITPNGDGSFTYTATATAAAAGKAIREYQWFFGDLTYASGQTVRHGYALPGTYPVTLYVTDSVGITSWRIQKLTVSQTKVINNRVGMDISSSEKGSAVPAHRYTIRGQRISSSKAASGIESLPHGVYLLNIGSGVKAKSRIYHGR